MAMVVVDDSCLQASLKSSLVFRLLLLAACERRDDILSTYRRTHSPSQVAWSEGWQPLVRCAAFIKWTEWTLAVTFSGHDDSTINIVLGLLLLSACIVIIDVRIARRLRL